MRPSAVLSTVLLLAATTSAWPSMLDNKVDALKREIAPLLVARQDDSSSSASSGDQSSSVEESTGTATGENSSGSRTTASATATSSSDNNNDDNKSSDSEKSTGSAKSSGKQTGSVTSMSGSKTSGTPSNTSMPQFDPRLPAGGASMITPDAMSPASYYKINQMVTFAWNYTSLSKNPQAVDVLATCTQNNAMYTIAANETFEQTQTIVWDTGKYQSTGTIPLLTETYTLIIHDAAKDISATASPGYLGTWKQFTFGMYEPQPYTPIADYVCATCNSAMSLMEKQTYGFLLTMVGVTVLTFGWFTGTAGLW